MVLTKQSAPSSTEGSGPDPIALWVVPVGDLGGVARHVLDVTRVGIPGWQVVVFCPEGPLSEHLRGEGTPVLTGAFGPEAGLRSSLASLRRTVAQLRPAVVHSHLSYADIAAFLALRPRLGRTRRPLLVSSEHGIAPTDLYHSSVRQAAVMARAHQVRCQLLDARIAVCESTRDVMRTKWRVTAPITVVRNGVDQETNPAPRTPGLRIASISRLAPEKGIDRLLDAFAVVRTSHPEAQLTVAGEGPLREALLARTHDLGLSASVTFPGHVHAPTLLAETDVVAQLSHWENCSYTILDACAAGVGVVATPVGGNPEILPESSLAEAADAGHLADLLIAQGEQPHRRPGLPAQWPTVADMTAQIADVYAGARR